MDLIARRGMGALIAITAMAVNNCALADEKISFVCAGEHSSVTGEGGARIVVQSMKSISLEYDGEYWVFDEIDGDYQSFTSERYDYLIKHPAGNIELDSRVYVTDNFIRLQEHFVNKEENFETTRELSVDRISGRISDESDIHWHNRHDTKSFVGSCRKQNRQF